MCFLDQTLKLSSKHQNRINMNMTAKNILKFALPVSVLASGDVFAAGGGIPHTIDYYTMVLEGLSLDPKWVPTVGALVVTFFVVLVGLLYKRSVTRAAGDVTPESRFSLRFVIESIMDMIYGLSKDNCGSNFKKYIPLLAGIFIFILFCNLSGLIPGFPPATVSIDTNLAMGLVVFIAYNAAGIKEHGGGYIKHFLGPVAAIAPLFFLIELISHGSRPLSLALRLTGNIFGDHTLLGVFTSLTYAVVPAFLLFFGLLVAVVQSFVFALLTAIYISLAISHDH